MRSQIILHIRHTIFSYLRTHLIIGLAIPFATLSSAFAQQGATNPGATAPAVDQNGNLLPAAAATAERVIVTGSNIPTAEEVGPNPVDTYRRDDITRLGVRTPTDLILRIT